MVAPVILAQVVSRARSAIKRGIHYGLGSGGRSPATVLPSQNGRCDCSGFVCWCLGIDRRRLIDGVEVWLNTDEMVRDANAPGGLFDRVPHAAPGVVIVYPWSRDRKRIGHCGIIGSVNRGDGFTVIHCSSRNDRKFGDAILETGPEVFLARPGTIFAVYRPLIAATGGQHDRPGGAQGRAG